MKKLISLCFVLFMAIFMFMNQKSIGQTIPPHPDDTICRCKGPENLCKGGNAISLNSRCGTSYYDDEEDRPILCSEFQSNCKPV